MENCKVYNKLVRDNIIDIIKKANKYPTYRILSKEEFWLSLLHKDLEELHKNASTTEHIKDALADKLEIIIAMANFYNYTLQDIMEAADKKREINGGFTKRIYL